MIALVFDAGLSIAGNRIKILCEMFFLIHKFPGMIIYILGVVIGGVLAGRKVYLPCYKTDRSKGDACMIWSRGLWGFDSPTPRPSADTHLKDLRTDDWILETIEISAINRMLSFWGFLPYRLNHLI